MVSLFNLVRATFCLAWDQVVQDMAVTEVDGVLAVVLCEAVASWECLDCSLCDFLGWGILVRNVLFTPKLSLNKLRS